MKQNHLAETAERNCRCRSAQILPRQTVVGILGCTWPHSRQEPILINDCIREVQKELTSKQHVDSKCPEAPRLFECSEDSQQDFETWCLHGLLVIQMAKLERLRPEQGSLEEEPAPMRVSCLQIPLLDSHSVIQCD